MDIAERIFKVEIWEPKPLCEKVTERVKQLNEKYL